MRNLEINLTQEQFEKLKSIKSLLSHKVPSQNTAEILEMLFHQYLHKNPLTTKSKVTNNSTTQITTPNVQSNSTALAKGQTISEPSPTVHPSCSDSQSTITKRFMENRDSKTHEALKIHKSKNNTNTQLLFKRTRYIPLHTRRMVFQRANYCCEFTGPNKERCESQFQLEIDHFIKPYSQGGDHSLDNLKLLST